MEGAGPVPASSTSCHLQGAPSSPTSHDHNSSGPWQLSLMLVWPVILGSSEFLSKGSELPPDTSNYPKVRGGSNQDRTAELPDPPPSPSQGLPVTSSSHLQAGQRHPGPQAPSTAEGAEAAPKRPYRLERRHRSGLLEDLGSRIREQKMQGFVFSENACAGEDKRAREPQGSRGVAYLTLALTLSLSVGVPRSGPIGVT